MKDFDILGLQIKDMNVFLGKKGIYTYINTD